MRGRRLSGIDDVVLPEVTTHDLAPLRHAPELAPCDLGDLDPDLALWPRTEVPRWPFTGPPTTGVWPTGWIGTDNQATVWVCTAGGTPGTWQPLVPGVTLPPSNGTDDTAMIQSAINTISATLAGTDAIGIVRGDPNTIYQLPNLFANTLTIAGLGGSPGSAGLVLASNVMLQGCNFNCPNPNFADNRYRGAVGISDGTVFCGVDHCSFEGNAVGPQTSEVPHEAILAGAASDVQITNNVCRHFYQSFLLALGSDNGGAGPFIFPTRWRVAANNVRFIQGGAIKFDGGALDVQVVQNVLGTNLSFPNYGAETILFNNPRLNNFNILIDGNQLFDSGPIDVISANNALITGNRVTVSAASNQALNMGIGCSVPVNVIITDNLIDWSLAPASMNTGVPINCINSSGVAAKNLRIIGNTCLVNPAGTTAGCIYVQDSASQSTDCIIAHNYCNGSLNNTIRLNQWLGRQIISDNTVVQPATGTFAIFLATSDPGIVDANNISNGAIFVNTPGNVDSEPFVVSNNKVASDASVACFRIQARSLVMGNTAFVPSGGAANAVLWLTAQTFGSLVTNNHLHTAAAIPVILDNSTGLATPNVIVGNYLRRDSGTPTISLSGGNTSVIRNNRGYNPVGAIVVAVPASGAATTALNTDATFYVTASTAAVSIAVTGMTSITVPPSTCVPIFVPAGAVVTPTYTTAPTWAVQGN